jgi:hypothetical protein
MIQMNTASTAPAIFWRLGQAASQAAGEVKKLEGGLLGLAKTLTGKVDPAVKSMGAAFKTLIPSGGSAFSALDRDATGFGRNRHESVRHSRPGPRRYHEGRGPLDSLV